MAFGVNLTPEEQAQVAAYNSANPVGNGAPPVYINPLATGPTYTPGDYSSASTNASTNPAGSNGANIAAAAANTPNADTVYDLSASQQMVPQTPQISEAQTQQGLVNKDDPAYQMDADKLNQTASTVEANQVAQVEQIVDPREAPTTQVQTTQQNVTDNAQVQAAQGQVRQEAIIDPPQLDVNATARGENEVGKALDDFASQDLNSVDSKATLKGQLDILQSEFVGPTGEPKIPSWAAGVARNVSKIAAFKGMTGTAATAAMSQALLEASVSVAQQDTQFFQTLTLQNLNNEQASIINKANVLSKMDLANLDSRMAAAVQNSKNFMDMDLTNLSNEQQAQVINAQSRFQSILEDAKMVNTARMFDTSNQIEMDKFYDQLNTGISQFNATQSNSMLQFNSSETNQMKQFNATMETQREQFYREMQYNIDVANAKWRQTVTLTNNQNKFDAVSRDVQNTVDMSKEQLNQLWDRSDALLDYLWKSSENELDRKQRLAEIKLQGDMSESSASSAGLGSIFGTVFGNLSESLFSNVFG